MVLIALAATCVSSAPSMGQAIDGGYAAVQYFLSDPPSPSAIRLAEKAGKNVLVAKVRIVEGPRYLVGRDASGNRPPHPPDLFWVKLEIVETIAGSLVPGAQQEAWFGKPGMSRIAWPRSSDMRRKQYFTISSVQDDGKRRLQELPMTLRHFDRWSEEAR
jgi:hypothetical protein